MKNNRQQPRGHVGIALARQGTSLIATLDNPPVNAISAAVRTALQALLLQLSHDDSIAALLLLGRGGHFSAGADIRDFGQARPPPALRDLCDQLEACDKLVVAAISGNALGGVLELAGRQVELNSPRDAARHGLTYLSEDRKGKGLHVHFGLRPNLTLMALERYARPWLQPAAEQSALRDAVKEFGIRTGSLEVRASSLSGGNQQKLALAKVLHPGPSVVVLDEPTRGVDVGAKREIYHLVQRLAAQGLAVIVISSELMELIGLCHRVAVMRAGRLQTTLQEPHLTEEELIAHATGTR